LELAGIESLPYSTIALTTNVLEDIKKLALGNLPPFDETSDKGFKDAYIYFSILEYLGNIEGESIFVVTKDDRLKLALNDNARVTVVKDFDEFEKRIDAYFRDDYFINRLKEEVSENVKAECINEIWLNSEENWVIKFTCNDVTHFVEVDFSSREIISSTNFDFSVFVNELINSGSFSTTHSMVSSLSAYVKYLSDQEIVNIIEASTDNSQIYSIATDEDVKEFFLSMYRSKSQIITDDEVIFKFKQIFKQD